MRNTLSVIVLVGALTSAGWASGQDGEKPPPYDETISNAQALDIAEATFRYQFDHNASGAQQKAAAYFLELFGKDPDLEFLARFKDSKPAALKGSAFKQGGGVKFKVEKIKRVRVDVSGGYYEGNLSASGNTYTLELKDGKWVVIGDKMHWIS